ncbi:MAG: hypothetical protein A4E45_00998 [Methanosaeta sp. PtaB.Bin039]|nr:MAG: hypothetical protein A4E45_00998 [Methanosaeta sp. PtaB.Bin039]
MMAITPAVVAACPALLHTAVRAFSDVQLFWVKHISSRSGVRWRKCGLFLFRLPFGLVQGLLQLKRFMPPVRLYVILVI